MASIFVSYSSDDRFRADAVRRWLEEVGWEVWLDREVPVGDPWEAEILSQIDRADAVVVLWGPFARRSEWVNREAQLALSAGKLVQIQATGLPLLPPFEEIQAVPLQSWSGEPVHREKATLLAAVARAIGEPQPNVEEAIEAPEPRLEIMGAIQAGLNYALAQVEWRCGVNSDLPGSGVAEAFEDLRWQLGVADDRDPTIDNSIDPSNVVHSLVRPFLERLGLCLPMSGAVN
jgi:hypothetical protein